MLDALGHHLGMRKEDLTKLNIAKMCIGGDHFGIHEGRGGAQWSMGSFFISPDDIPLDVIRRRENHWPLLIFPGPNHPSKMDAMLKMIVGEFKRYCPHPDNTATDSILVRPNSTSDLFTRLCNSDQSKFIAIFLPLVVCFHTGNSHFTRVTDCS